MESGRKVLLGICKMNTKNKLQLYLGTRPVKPKRPTKPQPPKETIQELESIYSLDGDDRISLAELERLVPDGISYSDVYIRTYHDKGWEGDCEFDGSVSFEKEAPNPYLKRQTTAYKTKLTLYEKDCKAYKKDYAKWKKEDAGYKEHKALASKLEQFNIDELKEMLEAK